MWVSDEASWKLSTEVLHLDLNQCLKVLNSDTLWFTHHQAAVVYNSYYFFDWENYFVSKKINISQTYIENKNILHTSILR